MKWFCKHEWSEILRTNTQLIFLCPACAQIKEFDIFCQHNWKEKERTIINSTSESLCQLYIDNCNVRLITNGSISILYECDFCKEHKVIEMEGLLKNDQ